MNQPTNQPTNSNKSILTILGGCALLLICVVCLGAVALGGLGYYFYQQEQVTDVATVIVTATAVAQVPVETPPTPEMPATIEPNDVNDLITPTIEILPTATVVPALNLTVPDGVIQSPIPARAFDDLDALYTAEYPSHDYFDTAVRLGQDKLNARTINGPEYTLGDTQIFQAEGESITAVLMAVTDHIYFWVDERLDYPQSELVAAAERLEKQYYPRLINLFGQEWQPGIDGDPHFSILHLSGEADGSELGYFSDTDEYPRQLYNESNEQELIYLIMGPLEFDEDLYYGTMVHEVQHLIQWYMDSNEATWLNEGLSQLAEIYLGLETADTYDYLRQPDIQLNTWEYENDTIDAHYAGAYLYSVYLWEQLGEDAIQELSRHPANGMASIRSILQGYDPDRNLVQFTADWAAANYLDNPAAGPNYHYRNLDFGRPDLELRLSKPELDEVKELNQFGVHYIELDFKSETVVTFAGDTVINLIDSPPRSGQQMWYAPPMDDTNQQLTAVFDLTNLNSATLKFSTWYDLEEDYDFVYLSISTDSGETWELLNPDNARAGEFGPAFNGRSDHMADNQDGWLKESIALNSYTGQTVMIRFEKLTDSAVTGSGFALDDISIPELGYQTDVENGNDGWQAVGFVQTGWQLPQQWAIQLIEDGPNPTVTPLLLDNQNQGQWSLNIGKGSGVLVIIPLSPFTIEPAAYWLKVQ